MPLPPTIIAAQDKMRQAETALHVHVDGGEHDPAKHRRLLESLQAAMREYEDGIASMLRDLGMRR